MRTTRLESQVRILPGVLLNTCKFLYGSNEPRKCTAWATIYQQLPVCPTTCVHHRSPYPIGPGLSGSSALRGPGGYPSSGGAASVSPALLRSSQTASETVVSNARTPIARPTAVPLYALCWRRWVLNRPTRLHNTFSVRLVLFRPNRPHMLWLPPPLGYFFY